MKGRGRGSGGRGEGLVDNTGARGGEWRVLRLRGLLASRTHLLEGRLLALRTHLLEGRAAAEV